MSESSVHIGVLVLSCTSSYASSMGLLKFSTGINDFSEGSHCSLSNQPSLYSVASLRWRSPKWIPYTYPDLSRHQAYAFILASPWSKMKLKYGIDHSPSLSNILTWNSIQVWKQIKSTLQNIEKMQYSKDKKSFSHICFFLCKGSFYVYYLRKLTKDGWYVQLLPK